MRHWQHKIRLCPIHGEADAKRLWQSSPNRDGRRLPQLEYWQSTVRFFLAESGMHQLRNPRLEATRLKLVSLMRGTN